MIREEFLHEGTLVKHWSDRYLMLLQEETGAKYGEAIDIVPCPYTYSEIEGEYVFEQWDRDREYFKDEKVIYKEAPYNSLIDNNREAPSNTEAWERLN